jgi:hypothetical protein
MNLSNQQNQLITKEPKMNHVEIEQHRLNSSLEHADQLLADAMTAADSYKESHNLTSYQAVLLVQSHMAAAVAYLNRGGL